MLVSNNDWLCHLATFCTMLHVITMILVFGNQFNYLAWFIISIVTMVLVLVCVDYSIKNDSTLIE
jgi:hypothetical protein